MTVYSGVATQVGFAVETTEGTPVTPATFLPLLGDKLMQERSRIESDAVRANRRFLDSNDWSGGNVNPNGDLQFELYQKDIGKIFTGMFGTVSSTTGPTGSLYTHTWTSAGQPKALTIQKGVPDVSGTVDPLTYAGSMINEWELACSAGEFVSLGITVAAMREFDYRQVTDGVTTSSSAAITSATAAFSTDDVGKPISGTNIPASTTILSVQSATAATLSANATGSGTSITFTIGIALASASYSSSLKPFAYHQGSISLASSAVSVSKLKVGMKHNLATDRYFIGSRYRKVPREAGLHELTGTLDMEWENTTQYLRFVKETEHSLAVRFTASGGEYVDLTMNVRLDGETPVVKDRGIVPLSIPFKAVGTTDAAALAVTYVTTDSTP
jgi:hypothetical protein